MSLVYDRYGYNASLYNAAQSKLAMLQHELDTDTLSSDQKSEIRSHMSDIRDIANSKMLSIDAKEWGQSVAVRTSNSVGQVIYGRCRVGGQITFVSTDQSDGGEYLHLVVTVACHEIESFLSVYLDGNILTFADDISPNLARWASDGTYKDIVFFSGRSLGADDQPANSDLVSQSDALFPGKWTENHRQRGCASSYFIFYYDIVAFPNGIPEISISLRGKNSIYDPRDESTAFNDNAVLCTLDYLLDSKVGPGLTLDDININSFSTGADVCEETVDLKAGYAEKRYRINGSFSASKSLSHKKVLNEMCNSFAGFLAEIDGEVHVFAGVYRSPVASFNEDDILSSLDVTVKPSKTDIFNVVRGQHRSDRSNWEWADYPPVRNHFYKDLDGEWIDRGEDLDFTLVSSRTQCMRIAKIKLEENRQWIEVTATFTLRSLIATVGDNITLSYDRFGWVNKEFTVHEQLINEGLAPTVTMKLRETAAGIYDWDKGEETDTDLAPNTILPNPNILPAPVNLQPFSGTDYLDLRSDGTVFSRLFLTWDSTTNPYILSDGIWRIQYKKSSETNWRNAGNVLGTETEAWILDVADGVKYDARVRAETSAKGPWAEIYGYQIIGKEEKPTTPSNLVLTPKGKWIEISWDGIDDKDIMYYEIRVGPVWESGSFLTVTEAKSYKWDTQEAGTYYINIAARDTSKLYSDAISAQITILPPGKVIGLNAVVINNSLNLNWSAPTITSFSIREYKIYKGVSFAGAELLGSVSATIKTLQEFLSGTYTYWVVAVDEYGNAGEEASVTVLVDAPPLFQLFADRQVNVIDYSSVTYIVVENDQIAGPIDTSKTFQDHFDDNSWSSPQDQIDAGFPIFGQPASAATAVYEQIIDFGTVFESAMINLSYLFEWIAGSGTITPLLSFSADNSIYTDGTSGSLQTLGSNFRYVKIHIEIAGDDNTSLARIWELRVRLGAKESSESGVTAAVSTDSPGTLVDTTATFLDVYEEKTFVSYKGTSGYNANFSVSGNSVYVTLWNNAGSRVSGDVRWTIFGVVATS